MRASLFFFPLLTIFLSLPFVSHARLAHLDDADMSVEYYKSDMVVHSDGTSESIIEIHQKILKEGGRSHAAHYLISYPEDVEKFTILSAKTIFEGKEYPIPDNSIEDKPMASAAHGFDQNRQVLLAFQNAEIGATIVLKYKMDHIKVPLDGFFSMNVYFDPNLYWKHAVFNFRSALPLFFHSNDPMHVFDLKHGKEGKHDLLSISLKKPVCEHLVNEPKNSILNPMHQSWVSISSLKDWNILAKRMGAPYAKVLEQPIPLKLKKIIDVAAKETDETAQINSITSQINEKVHYMGDWRTVEGKLFPRDLELIMKTQIGDCKDYTVLTGAALRALGFTVQAVSVARGTPMIDPQGMLPNLNYFNHAILRATSPKGRVYWIDPTNYVSMADGIFPDIAGKMVMVMDTNNPDFLRIPTIDSNHAGYVMHRTLDVANPERILETSILTLKGEEALDFSGLGLHLSQQELEEQLYNYVSGTQLEEQDKKQMLTPNLKSRIVKDVSIKYSFYQRHKTIHTNAGEALRLHYGYLMPFIEVTGSYVGDIYVGLPVHVSRRTIVQNAQATNIEDLNIALATPWIKVERQCRNLARDIEIVDNFTIPSSFLRNEDIKSPAYAELKRSLEKHFKDIAIIYTPVSQQK